MKSFRVFLVMWLAIIAAAPSARAELDRATVREAGSLPIQHNGRVKSFEAFARQTLTTLTTKSKWQKKPAVEWLWRAMNEGGAVTQWKWLRIDDRELLTALGLDPETHTHSYQDVFPSIEKVKNLVRSSQSKRDRDVRPTRLEQKAEQLFSKYILTERIASGEIFTVIPRAGHAAWTPPAPGEPLGDEFAELKKLAEAGSAQAFARSLEAWSAKAEALSGDTGVGRIGLELIYHRLLPFEASAALYFACFLLLSFRRKKSGGLQKTGVALFVAALLLHTAGLALRVVILQRPPVSNMYESMVFMNWALAVFALVFALIRRHPLVLSAASVISGFVMLYANLLPIDASLEVLVPVLRSNYWLTIHVMTIVASYGAFGLAMALGHRQLFLEVRGKLKKVDSQDSSALIYRLIQLGTLLVGAGTVLGGVWANESWGRFWGWDPKETWALITFIGYLIVVHLRHVGKLSDLALALSSLFGFQLVLMTWYGVNFVLGRGLHSYGQGSGGMEWVIYYLVAEAVFLAWVALKKFAR